MTNLIGVLNTVHPILDAMTSRKRGQIAILSSLAAFRGFPGAPAYCASKAAVRIYGEALRSDLAAHGVEVNVVCPGFIATPMTAVNPFRMPFLMSADRAAQLIKKGLERNMARIAFPLPMYFGIRFLASLPQILLDMLMPKLSGLSAIPELRQINPHIKIIGMTGSILDNLSSEMNAVMQELPFLHKPFNSEDVATMVNEVLCDTTKACTEE